MIFAQYILSNGGTIHPIIISPEKTNGTGLFNPSIYNDGGKLIVNLRHCQYSIWHSEFDRFAHQYGPLVYLNPENDITLTTTNFICEMDDDLNIKSDNKVDTSQFDVKPLWEFVGLEDVRIFRWHEKLFMCGVRRDTTTNGQGRMELSEIEIIDGSIKEVSRTRIPTPNNADTYCEKNWMPILDQPYRFVKWTNPTEVVEYDPVEHKTTTIHMGQYTPKELDMRGGSQVIPWNDGYMCLVHETSLYKTEKGSKNATYRHRFVIWDKNFNNMRYSKVFSFMDGKIEFACGMAKKDENVYITFGFQDNCAFILKCDKKVIEDFINE